MPGAQARAAIAGKAAELAKLSVTAARYHRQAVQADYFPKIGATFANLHFNKFMGQELVLAFRTTELPLVNKNQSLFAVTVMQPVTPLFKVHEAVRIARADERIAQAKADAMAAQVAANVERTYLSLLVAAEAASGVRDQGQVDGKPGTKDEPGIDGVNLRIARGRCSKHKAVVNAKSQVTELTQSLNTLMGLPLDTQLELADPPPLIEPISSGLPTQQSIDGNPEVVEAQETLVKARAASRLSKLDYVPDVAGLWGYSYQTAIPALPRDFSFVGFMATWNVFDFGKRERTMSERSTQVKMAETNLALVRAKVAASTQKASLDVQRTRRILELTRRVASMYRAMPADYQTANLEITGSRAEAEGEMFQAELDYRLACAEFKRTMGNLR